MAFEQLARSGTGSQGTSLKGSWEVKEAPGRFQVCFVNQVVKERAADADFERERPDLRRRNCILMDSYVKMIPSSLKVGFYTDIFNQGLVVAPEVTAQVSDADGTAGCRAFVDRTMQAPDSG